MGYNEGEIQQALNEVEKEALDGSFNKFNQAVDPRQNTQISAFSSKHNDDIVRWQLELNDILERVDHILKGDIPTFKDGNIIWDKNPNPENNTLNEYGVRETMKILSLYINRNTILSDYTQTEINFKVFDFGREINNLFFMRYEDFGMDTEEKRKNYPMIIREIVDIVHSSYKRALFGGERRSIREMINVSQTTNTQMGAGGTPVNPQMPARERGLLNPMRIIKGRYV